MKRTTRTLSLLLALAMSLSMLVTTAYAVTLTDIKYHWAEQYIYSAVDAGYVSGYDDNTFKPGKAITRAEFCKMLNNALGLTATANISFSDVPTAKWYYKEVQKAVAAGYISGYENGTFLGDNQISRQEAAVVIARIIADPVTLKDMRALKDASSIASWALPGAQAVYAKGYMAGDDLGKFNPRGNLTRAEAVKIIETLRKGETIVPGNITISESGQSYSNKIFTGSVIVSSALGEGNVTFKNCKILGTLLVNGGGQSGIRLSNTGVANLTLNSAHTTGIAAVGSSTVSNAYLSTSCALVESGLTGLGAGFKNVTIGGSGLSTANISLSGTFDSVDLNAWSYLTLQSGSIAKLHVGTGATGSEITLPAGTKVTEATIDTGCDFFGAGTIDKAVKNASGVTFETKPAAVTGSAAGEDDQKPEAYIEMTSIPKHNTQNIPLDTDIILTFNEVIRNKTGGGLTVSYVKENVSLRLGSEDGAKVDYAPSISQSGMVLTLSPTADLDEGQSYYLSVNAGAFTGTTSGNGNAAMKAVFHTEGAEVEITPVEITASPKGGSEIADDDVLTFTLNAPVYDADGKNLTASYLQNTAFSIRRGSKSGTKVAFTAAISSDKKTITLTPDADLTAGNTYYVTLAADTLMNGDWETNSAQTFTYTVPAAKQPDVTIEEGMLAPVETYPAQKGTGVSTGSRLMLVFDEALYQPDGAALTAAYLQNTALELRRSSLTGTKTAISAGWGKTMNMVTVTPASALGEGYTYYLILKEGTVMNADGDLNDKYVLFFTTGEEYNLTAEVEPSKTTAELTVAYDVTDFDPSAIHLTIRYREEGLSSWTILQRDQKLTKVKNTLSYDLKGLSAETPYEVEVTLDLDDTSLSAETTFETTDTATSSEAIAIEKIRFYSNNSNSDSYYLYADDFEETDTNEYYAVLPSKQALLADENDEIRVRVYTYDSDAEIYVEGEYDMGDTVASGSSYYIEVDPADLSSYLTIEVEDSWGDKTYYEIKIYLD